MLPVRPELLEKLLEKLPVQLKLEPVLPGSSHPSRSHLWHLNPIRKLRYFHWPGRRDLEASQFRRRRLLQRRGCPSLKMRMWLQGRPSRRCPVLMGLPELAALPVALSGPGRPMPRSLNLDLLLLADCPRRLRCQRVLLPDRRLPRSRPGRRLLTSPNLDLLLLPGLLSRRRACPSRRCLAGLLARPIPRSSNPVMTIRELSRRARAAAPAVLSEPEVSARPHQVEPVPGCSSHCLHSRWSGLRPSLLRRSWPLESSNLAGSDPSPVPRKGRVGRCRCRPSRRRRPVTLASSNPDCPVPAALPVRESTRLLVRRPLPVPARRSARRPGGPVGTRPLEPDPVSVGGPGLVEGHLLMGPTRSRVREAPGCPSFPELPLRLRHALPRCLPGEAVPSRRCRHRPWFHGVAWCPSSPRCLRRREPSDRYRCLDGWHTAEAGSWLPVGRLERSRALESERSTDLAVVLVVEAGALAPKVVREMRRAESICSVIRRSFV